MKHHIALCALFIGAIALTACGKKDGAATAADGAAASPPVATVDGKPISRELYDFYAKNVARKPVAELTPEQRDQILDDLVRLHIVADTAVKEGLDKDKDVAPAIELTRLNLLTQAAVKKQLGTPPTEQEMRAEYETYVAEQPKFEYRARHILVATEPFAQTLIDKINKGASFADIARKESMDGSKTEGGDLGWFTPARMVTPFANAVTGLEKGQMTQKPVQTQFGWHIIKLEDTRDLQVPDYDQMKGELEKLVQQKKVQAYLEELKKTHKIEKTLEPKAAEAPKS